MKKYLILICLGVCCLCACNKEDDLESTIVLDNLYAIQDDSSDPVKHRVYELYTKYDVPVYFNDTIGKYLLKTDVSGKPIYRYELLDPAWSWTSYSSLEYSYEYLKDAEQQMKTLDVVEEYLANNQPAMYPFCFFIADSIMMTGMENNAPKTTVLSRGAYSVGFRAISLTPGSKQTAQAQATAIKRTMVRTKVGKYTDELVAFNAVSDPNWYGQKMWLEIDPALGYVSVDYLDPDYSSFWEMEEYESKRVEQREICGPFGFVMGSTTLGGMFSPYDAKADLECFVKVMLATPDKVFREQWEMYPLVMEKYEVLYKIITEKLGVEL